MTDMIESLRKTIVGKKHHIYRHTIEKADTSYVNAPLPAHRLTALRFVSQLACETPAFIDGERISFMRTCAPLPRIYDDVMWAEVTKDKYIHELGNVSNISADWGRVIASGLKATRDELNEAAEKDPDGWQASVCMELDALFELCGRYAVAAEERGMEETAEMLRRVPMYGARTFPEALQSLRILHYCAWCEGNYHVTLGRFDIYMRPYYEKALADGMTEDEALEWIEEFFIDCNRDSDLYPGMQQGDNGQSLVLGGRTREGGEGYSRLSELCLEASAALGVIDPKINLRVDKNTKPETYVLGTRLTKLGLGFPQYENDDVVIPGLKALGYREEDANDYVVAACWEFIIPGRGMEVVNIGAMPLADVVKTSVINSLESASSMDDIISEIKNELNRRALAMPEQFKNLWFIPSPYYSCFFEGCVENGRDISLGCVYNNFGIHGTGLATAVDSLAAVEQAVFTEGYDKKSFLKAMENDFACDEKLRHELREICPKMGNDDDRADKYAGMLLGMFADSLKGYINERGGIYRAGTGSAMYYVTHAAKLGATPDGRYADEALPANYAPSLCAKVKGPASVMRSFSKPDLSATINGGPLTIEFHDSVFRNDDAVGKAAALVRYYMLQGGHQLQLNTVNRDTLLDAQKHPENYKNLIVRVWGWSGYFVELDKCYQDHIIKRVEMTL